FRHRGQGRQHGLVDAVGRLAAFLARHSGARLPARHPRADVLARRGPPGVACAWQAAALHAHADDGAARWRAVSRLGLARRRPAGPVDHAVLPAPRACRHEPAGIDRRAGLAYRALSLLVLAADCASGRARGRRPRAEGDAGGTEEARPQARGGAGLVGRAPDGRLEGWQAPQGSRQSARHAGLRGWSMTWSLIARDPASGAFGIAVATKNFAVGCRVPHIVSGIGAVATQALSNPFYGVNGIKLLREGKCAAEGVRTLTAADEGREHRQLHVMDAAGRTAAYTGKECIDWCGSTAGEGFSVAGNMLAGPSVIAETAKAYVASASQPFPRRLIAALQAGEAAGGDKRGKQSAALLIHGEEEWPDLDLRVDDHTDPLAELSRLEGVSRERWVHFSKFLPNKRNPVGIIDRAQLDARIAAALAEAT